MVLAYIHTDKYARRDQAEVVVIVVVQEGHQSYLRLLNVSVS